MSSILNQPVAVVDVETAQDFGNDYQPICAIAICDIETDGTIKEPHKFLVQPPNNEISEGTQAVHGITPEMTKDAPDIKTLWPEILELFGDKLLAAHNADFDFKILEKELEVNNLTSSNNKYICTLDIARAALPEIPGHGLANLVEAFNIELDHHDPASDAKATAEILKIMLKHKSEEDPVALSEKLEIPVGIFGKPPRWEGGLRPYERKPHFVRRKNQWIIAAPIGSLNPGDIVNVEKKSGEISVVKLGSKFEEIKSFSGGELVLALEFEDAT